MNDDHPVRLAVEYPDRQLDRLATALRMPCARAAWGRAR